MPRGAALGLALVVLVTGACGASTSKARAGSGTTLAKEKVENLRKAGTSARPLAVLPDGRIDPTKVNLGGVPGVTVAEQHRAEDLLRRTLIGLPHWDNIETARAAGFFSLEDQNAAGYVHWVNAFYIQDQTEFDPRKPESLVYRQTSRGHFVLVAAMYMLKPHSRFSDVPDIGGALTQWHIHNLCFQPGTFNVVAQRRDGSCRRGFAKPADSVPMIHVWLVPRRCGPFSALEGGLGVEDQGKDVLCDDVHGS